MICIQHQLLISLSLMISITTYNYAVDSQNNLSFSLLNHSKTSVSLSLN